MAGHSLVPDSKEKRCVPQLDKGDTSQHQTAEERQRIRDKLHACELRVHDFRCEAAGSSEVAYAEKQTAEKANAHCEELKEMLASVRAAGVRHENTAREHLKVLQQKALAAGSEVQALRRAIASANSRAEVAIRSTAADCVRVEEEEGHLRETERILADAEAECCKLRGARIPELHTSFERLQTERRVLRSESEEEKQRRDSAHKKVSSLERKVEEQWSSIEHGRADLAVAKTARESAEARAARAEELLLRHEARISASCRGHLQPFPPCHDIDDLIRLTRSNRVDAWRVTPDILYSEGPPLDIIDNKSAASCPSPGVTVARPSSASRQGEELSDSGEPSQHEESDSQQLESQPSPEPTLNQTVGHDQTPLLPTPRTQGNEQHPPGSSWLAKLSPRKALAEHPKASQQTRELNTTDADSASAPGTASRSQSRGSTLVRTVMRQERIAKGSWEVLRELRDNLVNERRARDPKLLEVVSLPSASERENQASRIRSSSETPPLKLIQTCKPSEISAKKRTNFHMAITGYITSPRLRGR